MLIFCRLRRPDPPIAKIDGTGEAVRLLPAEPANVKRARNPVAAAGTIIDGGPSKGNVRRAEAFRGLLPDSLLAAPNGLLGGEWRRRSCDVPADEGLLG